MNLIWVTNAEYLGDYRLLLTFNNSEKRVFDGKDYILSHPMFSDLKNKKKFSDFQLDGWTVSWQNGSLDLAPEFLYENGE